MEEEMEGGGFTNYYGIRVYKMQSRTTQSLYSNFIQI